MPATSIATSQLAALRRANPELFSRVAGRIQAIRDDPGGANAGRVFMLDDGTAARLATFYDLTPQRDLVLVWTISVDDSTPTMAAIRAEHVD